MSAATGAGCVKATQYFLRASHGIQANELVESPSLIWEGPSSSGAKPEGETIEVYGDKNITK
jgi:hypothetical protein